MNISFFRAWALIMSIFKASIFTFFSLFLCWPVKVLRFLKRKSQTFIFVVGNNKERGKRSCGKKNLFLLKTPHSLFSPALSFSVFKTSSTEIFEIFLKNKPVHNAIYSEVVVLNPSLLYTNTSKGSHVPKSDWTRKIRQVKKSRFFSFCNLSL